MKAFNCFMAMHNPVSKQKSKMRSLLPWAVVVGTQTVASFLLFNAPASAQQNPPIFQNTTVSPNFSGSRTLQGITGGSVPASQVAGGTTTATGPCVGYVDSKPAHTVVLNSFFRNLSIEVASPADTTLVVKGPGGTWCNDDSEGKNPGITGQWLEGSYNLWVGTYQKDQYTPYTVRISR